MIFNKDKDTQIFLQRLTKLTPEEFIALGKILDIKMSNVDAETGEYAVRDAEEIIDDMIVAFRHFKHKERQLILKAMTVHKTTKELVEDVHNGPLS